MPGKTKQRHSPHRYGGHRFLNTATAHSMCADMARAHHNAQGTHHNVQGAHHTAQGTHHTVQVLQRGELAKAAGEGPGDRIAIQVADNSSTRRGGQCKSGGGKGGGDDAARSSSDQHCCVCRADIEAVNPGCNRSVHRRLPSAFVTRHRDVITYSHVSMGKFPMESGSVPLSWYVPSELCVSQSRQTTSQAQKPPTNTSWRLHHHCPRPSPPPPPSTRHWYVCEP